MESEGISDGVMSERKEEVRVRRNGRKDKVIVEKSAAEGLPEGWIKKLVISNKTGRKIRRDPYFIDPKGGYIFQSFRDALRYAETGHLGSYARKVQEEDDASENGNTVLPLESVEKTSADEILEKEEKININATSSKRRNLSSSDEHPENCELSSDLSNVTSQVLEELGKKDEAKDLIENQPIPKRITRSQAKVSKNEEDLDLKRKTPSSSNGITEKDTVKSKLSSASSQDLEKEAVMKEEAVQDCTGKQMTKSKAKVKKFELSDSITRRASKRLAGIELEPTPELKKKTKAPRVIPLDDGTAGKCKQPLSPVAVSPVVIDSLKKTDTPINMEVAKSYNEHSSPKPNASTAGKCKQPASPVATESLKKTDTPLNKEVAESCSGHSSPRPNADTARKRKQPASPVAIDSLKKTDTPLNKEVAAESYSRHSSPKPNGGTAGKRKQPASPVIDSLKKTDTILNKEDAKSYSEHSSPKPNAAATSNNGLSAGVDVRIEKISKPVGRNGSGDKKKMKKSMEITEFELNPVFHLDGYKQNEEMSPVSPLSHQTSAPKREKTPAGKRLGQSSPKANIVTSPKKISPLRSPNKGKRLFDDSNAIQKRNKLSIDSSEPFVVRGTCSEVMETSSSSFSSTFDSTLADMWKDPCIAFAIKTLTGESMHLPHTTAVSSDPKQKEIAFLPETPSKANTASETPGCSMELPDAADIWNDPCIDFAIKTLTGVIPIGENEPHAKATGTTAMQEQKGRQSSDNNKTEELRFTQSFFKD